MAETIKNLGQAIPASNVLTALYTVPGARVAVVSSLLVCNQGSTPAKFRVSHAVSAESDSPKQYLYYDQAVPAKNTFAATLGLSLGAADVIQVLSDTGLCSFNLYGTEIA